LRTRRTHEASPRREPIEEVDQAVGAPSKDQSEQGKAAWPDDGKVHEDPGETRFGRSEDDPGQRAEANGLDHRRQQYHQPKASRPLGSKGLDRFWSEGHRFEIPRTVLKVAAGARGLTGLDGPTTRRGDGAFAHRPRSKIACVPRCA